MRRIAMAAAVAIACGAAHGQTEDVRKLTEESRKVANDLVAQVRSELAREFDFSGPLKTVIV
jgi:hypothetical protein